MKVETRKKITYTTKDKKIILTPIKTEFGGYLNTIGLGPIADFFDYEITTNSRNFRETKR